MATVTLVAKPTAAKTQKPKAQKLKSAAVPVRRKGESIALFVDLDNTNISRDNLLEMFSILKTKGNIVFGKLYGYTDDKVAEFEEIIAEHRLETTGKLRFKTDGVSVIDTRLVVDCLTITARNKFDMVFVWAGVGDLIPLFTKLRENKCKTMTVDNDEFDCNNKFVDQKIKLFSPHVSVLGGTIYRSAMPQARIAAVAPVQEVSKPKSQPITPNITLGRGDVPNLPRKKGAPEFGTKEKEFDPSDEGDGITAEDNAQLLRMAREMLKDMDIEREDNIRKKPEYIADFGDLEFLDDSGNKNKITTTRYVPELESTQTSLPAEPQVTQTDKTPPSFEDSSNFLQQQAALRNEAKSQDATLPKQTAPQAEPSKIEKTAPAEAAASDHEPAKPLAQTSSHKPPKTSKDVFDDFGELADAPSGGGYDEAKYDPEDEKEEPPKPQFEDFATDFNTFDGNK